MGPGRRGGGREWEGKRSGRGGKNEEDGDNGRKGLSHGYIDVCKLAYNTPLVLWNKQLGMCDCCLH